jgi:hypothetical protein
MNGRSIEDEAREMMRANCGHFCHRQGLNPWIEECSVCGCENPKYDPGAVSDIHIEPNPFFDRGPCKCADCKA